MVEVARGLVGAGGAGAILLAGLLATVSSANASLLSSSRAVYALAKDKILPEGVSHINLRFGTPHRSLVLAGGPTLVLVAVGDVELLAEVASLLHLIMYGLLCFGVIAMRRQALDWYEPSFTTPGYPVLPIIGGVACFGLIAFMQPASIVVGGVIIVATAAWHRIYASDVRLKGVSM